jgi:hypothetical protein
VVHAHIYKEPFFIPQFTLPPGRVAWIQTDRQKEKYELMMATLGLWNHPDIHIENFLDDISLHTLTRPNDRKKIVERIDKLRMEMTSRLRNEGIGTVILDLYDPFHHSSTNSEASYWSRQNAIWAGEMNALVLAVVYPFKQTSMKHALRVQDRISGFLQIQSSMDWKITIIDAEEQIAPYWSIYTVPPMSHGRPFETLAIRGKEEEGDPIGLFRKYEGPRLPDIGDIMIQWDCGETKAYSIRKKLAAGEDPEYIH